MFLMLLLMFQKRGPTGSKDKSSAGGWNRPLDKWPHRWIKVSRETTQLAQVATRCPRAALAPLFMAGYRLGTCNPLYLAYSRQAIFSRSPRFSLLHFECKQRGTI